LTCSATSYKIFILQGLIKGALRSRALEDISRQKACAAGSSGDLIILLLEILHQPENRRQEEIEK
jgi:hypothetical protein